MAQHDASNAEARSESRDQKMSFPPADATPARETNQAERAAMHPELHEIDWRYYHGAWSG